MKLRSSDELDDAVEMLPDLAPRDAVDRAGEEDVLGPGELGVEGRAQLDERGELPVDGDRPPRSDGKIPARTFSSAALARPVRPDDAEDLALADGEVEAAQGPQLASPPPAEEARGCRPRPALFRIEGRTGRPARRS